MATKIYEFHRKSRPDVFTRSLDIPARKSAAFARDDTRVSSSDNGETSTKYIFLPLVNYLFFHPESTALRHPRRVMFLLGKGALLAFRRETNIYVRE